MAQACSSVDPTASPLGKMSQLTPPTQGHPLEPPPLLSLTATRHCHHPPSLPHPELGVGLLWVQGGPGPFSSFHLAKPYLTQEGYFFFFLNLRIFAGGARYPRSLPLPGTVVRPELLSAHRPFPLPGRVFNKRYCPDRKQDSPPLWWACPLSQLSS